MIHFLVNAAGTAPLDEYLKLEVPELVRRFRVMRYEDLPHRRSFDRGTYVFSAMDQLSPGMDRLVRYLHDRLAAEPGVRILNDPSTWVHRFDLLKRLHADGNNDYRVFRATDDLRALRFPAFIRGERSHDGNISPLLNSMQEVERAVGLALVQGNTLDDLMVIEFCSTVDPDGFYRKYAAFKVGERIQGRSLFHSTKWMVKFEDAVFNRETVQEEVDYVRNNPHADEIRRIFELARIEYGLIDYSFKDGRIQTWEINLHPTIGRGVGPDGGVGPRELRPIRTETREYFFDWFREAWAEVDAGGEGLAPVTVEFSQEMKAAALARGGRRQRILDAVRAALRPVKPVIAPLTRLMLRGLGFLARKQRQR